MISPPHYGQKCVGQPTVRRLISTAQATLEETRYLLLVRQREPTVSCQLCCSTRLRAGGARHAFGPRQLPSKPCRPRRNLRIPLSPHRRQKAPTTCSQTETLAKRPKRMAPVAKTRLLSHHLVMFC